MPGRKQDPSLPSPLPDDFPQALRPHARSLRLANGERLFSIGQRPRQMFFVVSGELRLSRASQTGGEAVLQRGQHGFIAEASIESTAYHCDATAIALSDVLATPIPLIRRLLDEDAGFRADWLARMAREVRRLRAQCERLSLKSAAARILHYLETETGSQGYITIPSRKAWAAELGLSHEALYRNLARLRAAGTIELQAQSIRLATAQYRAE